MDKHTCKHFNGSRNSHCEAGVCYGDVTPDPDEPGSMFRKPCLLPDRWSTRQMNELAGAAVRGQCAKFALPSAAELEAAENDRKARSERMSRVLVVVNELRDKHRDKGFSGQAVCPICNGVLGVSIAASNSHAWVRCGTPDCVSWME